MPLVNEALIQKFSELASVEREAWRLYKTLLPYISNEVDKKVLQGIMADEKRHEQLALEIVEILRKS